MLNMIQDSFEHYMHKVYTIITAGATYLDIDAYACSVAMAELLNLQGKPAVAYSPAPGNYSVCSSLVEPGQILKELPASVDAEKAQYFIVDVSDPDYLSKSVPLNQIVAVYDHHAGFESYWENRIGENAHIEFIGAAATLVYREWKKAGLQDQMSRSAALLLIAAILDNTLNLMSSNTTQEDIDAFNALCRKEHIDAAWCAAYFTEVQENVEKDLKNALFHDLKMLPGNPMLPGAVAQLCLWNTERVLKRLPEIRKWFGCLDSWMMNIIDLQARCSYFVCDMPGYQRNIEKLFGVRFAGGVAKTEEPYLRKEIIKKTLTKKHGG